MLRPSLIEIDEEIKSEEELLDSSSSCIYEIVDNNALLKLNQIRQTSGAGAIFSNQQPHM